MPTDQRVVLDHLLAALASAGFASAARGSLAAGTADAHSDIDLAVSGDPAWTRERIESVLAVLRTALGPCVVRFDAEAGNVVLFTLHAWHLPVLRRVDVLFVGSIAPVTRVALAQEYPWPGPWQEIMRAGWAMKQAARASG